MCSATFVCNDWYCLHFARYWQWPTSGLGCPFLCVDHCICLWLQVLPLHSLPLLFADAKTKAQTNANHLLQALWCAGEFVPSQGCHLAASHSSPASQGKVSHAEYSSRWTWDWPLVSSQLQVLYWFVKFQHHLPCPYLGLSTFCSFTPWGCVHGCCAWFELCGGLVVCVGTNPASNGFLCWSQSTPVAGQVGIPWFLELHVRLL